MPPLLEYLNQSLIKPFFSRKFKHLTMSSSDVIGTTKVEVVACYIKSGIGYLQKHFFQKEIENIFFEILLPKTKPQIVGIIYSPPNQNNFLEIINANFDKLRKLRLVNYYYY